VNEETWTRRANSAGPPSVGGQDRDREKRAIKNFKKGPGRKKLVKKSLRVVAGGARQKGRIEN